MLRLVIELRNRNLLNSDDLVIDTADDIPNAPGGNRQRVENLHAQIGGSPRFAGFVDREFREFDLAVPADQAPHHCVVSHNLFWTRGHSIENYFITLDFVLATLVQHHPEHLPDNYATILAAAFPGIVRACATIALASQAIFKLDRVRDVKRIDLWKVDGAGDLVVDLAALQSILNERGIDETDRGRFMTYWDYYTPRLATADVALSQWICHGHLADSHVWCAVAALLRHFGMPDMIVRQVWSRKDVQFRATSERWCQSCAAGLGEHPLQLVQWLRG